MKNLLALLFLLAGIVACDNSTNPAISDNVVETTVSSADRAQAPSSVDSVVDIYINRDDLSSSSSYITISSSSYVTDSDFKKICVGVLHEILDYSTLSAERPVELCAAEKRALQLVDFSNDDVHRCFELMDPYCLGSQENSRSSPNCCRIAMDYDTDFKIRLCNAKKLKGDADFVECDCSCVE